jgi:hypothetical protein
VEVSALWRRVSRKEALFDVEEMISLNRREDVLKMQCENSEW